ncbi:leucine-rich PPR motif-containing protein, mitochondrial [Genypterus blacodes]|uniref:leucine-rich PPR motif-containing protein, mitochondrial n=1 Tax=Genypterus blacodes TaxID=154954 RepID=UPI003F76B06A
MAALLRSARLLKCLPSGLLHVARTNRTGPSFSRLCSGALGGRGAGACSRQTFPARGQTSSGVWPCATGCVRTYAMATEQQEDGSLSVRTMQVVQFDWALNKLDSSVRNTGRVTKTLLLQVFHDICRTGYPSGNQALLLLRSCGSLLPEVPPQERTELAHQISEKLQQLNALYDVSHYNALLKVYLQNEFKFSPTDFLAKMETADIQPNRVTYQRLIDAYCQDGDIEGASTILGFMKSKDLPVTEAVFNSLVTGHARAGDLESAENILLVMKAAGIEPGPDTFVSLISAYAEKGDMENLKKTMEAADSADCSLMDRDLMQVIFTLVKAGHQQHVPEMTERMRHERGFVPDAMNLCLSLITQGEEDAAFDVLKTFPQENMRGFSEESLNQGNFFLRHCVNMGTSIEKISRYCRELQESRLHASPLQFTLLCALQAKKTDVCLEMMKMLKEQNLPVRPHYFWPLFTPHVKDKNTAGVIELVKAMVDLGVTPDGETFSNYILPSFPSNDAARQALKDAGIPLDSESFLYSEFRSTAMRGLAELYTLMSSPEYPQLTRTLYRGILTMAFIKSSDVEHMVKITELMSKEGRPTEGQSESAVQQAHYFLYHLINTMSEAEVKAQEDKLREFFKQLHAQNFTIPGGIYRGIRNLLMTYQLPELLKDVLPLVEKGESNGASPAPSHNTGSEYLEKKLADQKQNDQQLSATLRHTISALCSEENLERALELKLQHEEDMTAASYASLIHLCTRLDKVDEALNLKREMSQQDSAAVLDAGKYVGLVKTLAMNDRVEEAVDILKEMKEKKVLNETDDTFLSQMLRFVGNKGDITTIRRLQDTIFSLGLAKPTANLCSPLINAHLQRKDIAASLEAAMEYYKNYNILTGMHAITVALVEKGDTELLQKAMDFLSREQGEMAMLYSLFFTFLQLGRYREARKIIETPGLRAKPGRLQWFADKCISTNKMEPLEQMVDMTAKLFECDRNKMYQYTLQLCKETNNWQKAEALWTKMQEENVVPRESTLRLLADILKKNGQEVPFVEPETWYEQAATNRPQATKKARKSDVRNYRTRLLSLCKKGKGKEAVEILQEANGKGVPVLTDDYNHVIRALLAGGLMEDAMNLKATAESHIPDFQLSATANSLLIVTQSKKGQAKDGLESLKSMLQANQVPLLIATTRLVQALGSRGDVAGIQEVKSLMIGLGTPLHSSMLFVNNEVMAHIKNEDLDSAVEVLEALYTGPEGADRSMSYVFRKLMEDNNEKALDKLSAMAERVAHQFACYRPSTDLFLQLLDMDKVEDAKFMLERCSGLAEQKTILLSYLTKKAQSPGQVGKIKTLVSLIPTCVKKELMYSYLMKCHTLDNDLTSAKALYEQMQKEGLTVDDLSLKRLASLYQSSGETVPFTEPPESYKFYADKLKEQGAKTQATAEE